VRHSGPKGGATDRPSRNDCRRRHERFPEGIKREESSLVAEVRDGIRRGVGLRFGVWDEPTPGDTSKDTPVGVLHITSTQSAETAVYVTCVYGGVGGGRP